MQISFSKLGSRIKQPHRFHESCTLYTDAEDLDQLHDFIVRPLGSRSSPIRNCEIFLSRTFRGPIIIGFRSDNCRLNIGAETRCNLQVNLWVNSTVDIGAYTTMNGVRLEANNSEVIIGEDCMFSDEIIIQTSDQHAIVDLNSGQIINNQRRVTRIEDHCWIGRRAMLMPDIETGFGSVVAAGAVVTQSTKALSIVAGVPARIVREQATWLRSPSIASEREIQRYLKEGIDLSALASTT